MGKGGWWGGWKEDLVGSFFFLVNAGESVTQDLNLVLVFKDHQVQIYFEHSHMCRIIWENTWGENFFFNLNASTCT